MATPKRRIIHTNWTEYRHCDTKKPYQFRVSVELVGIGDNDPNALSLCTVSEILSITAEAMEEYVGAGYECGNCGSRNLDHECDDGYDE